MKTTADEIFTVANIPIAGNEELHQRVQEILGSKMAELSVMTATGTITWKQRIRLFEEQKQSLIEEVRSSLKQ